MSARIVVDGSRCTGHARCYLTSPDLLEQDVEGFVSIRGGSLELVAEQLPAAHDAADACPERAITVIVDDRETP